MPIRAALSPLYIVRRLMRSIKISAPPEKATPPDFCLTAPPPKSVRRHRPKGSRKLKKGERS